MGCVCASQQTALTISSTIVPPLRPHPQFVPVLEVGALLDHTRQLNLAKSQLRHVEREHADLYITAGEVLLNIPLNSENRTKMTRHHSVI